MSEPPRVRRVRAVLAAARRLVDPADPLGRRARAELPAATGLSPEGVALALERHVETRASDAELASLLAWAGEAPAVHVVLSANVFVGAVRALALALAASARVRVRPSRREPALAPLLVEALHDGAPDLDVALVETLAPAPGDEVHAYGRDETLVAIAASLPPGVRLRGHGSGLGVAVASPADPDDVDDAAERLSWDVAAFDQRGCLSPRAVLAPPALVPRLAAALAAALARREAEVPRGALDAGERAALAAWRASVETAGALRAGAAWAVAELDAPRALPVAPPGRHLVVAGARDAHAAAALVAPLARVITAIGTDDADGAPARSLRALAPGARVSPLGAMQRSPLDGPVDRRGG